jgi:uncharacterized membrane protein YidH (DUF202 family)
MKRRWFLSLIVLFCSPFTVFGQAALALPVASTLDIETPAGEVIVPGTVIRYDAVNDRYTVSTGLGDMSVYGVVADRPAVVFVTSASAVPVVTEGVTPLLVTMESGPVARGDVLTTATMPGQAKRAGDEDTVFAMALEDATEAGLVLAYIGAEEAKAAQAQRAAISAPGGIIVSAARAALAAVLVLGAIGFLLYSFRSIMTTGVISIGRNPRARQSVLWVSVGSMILAIVLTGLVVFVAIGILILPV